MKKTLAERLHEKLMPIPESGCLIYLGHVERFGHGKIGIAKDKNERTHRVAWMLKHGNIPDGMCVLHKCDVPSCCNVDHLFLGTRKDNNIDKAKKGRALKKLSLQDVREIKKTTGPLIETSKLYGVGCEMVSMIRRGIEGRYA